MKGLTTEAEVVTQYKAICSRCDAVGLTLKVTEARFEFNIKEANGSITMLTLAEVERFLRGYELAYKASL
jgi:hypothetical protein